MTPPFLPKNAFPHPAPLTPALIALGLDGEAAGAISKVYLSAALTLKGKWEAEYVEACHALVATSDNHGYSSTKLRAKLLTVLITRYSQALSEWMAEVIHRAEASVLKKKKSTGKHKTKSVAAAPSRPDDPRVVSEPRSEKGRTNNKRARFNTAAPKHAFPCPYPPPARPGPLSFVTHMPLLERGSNNQPGSISENDLDACIDQFSRLSLDSLSPQNTKPHGPSKPAPKLRPRTRATTIPKPTSRLSPSCPRPVSPKLDTSVAVSHGSPPAITPSHPFPPSISRTQNIDIPRSTRRKVCSIPYRRPIAHPSSSPESSSSSHSPCSIRRTPSLVSDHGSEASSPSTPPDIPFMPTPTFAFARKDSSPDAISSLEQSLAPYPELGWQDFDLGIDLYG